VRAIDIVVVCLAVSCLVSCAAIVARQRYLLRSAGAIPLAIRRGPRWIYGVARYSGSELRWYRSLGFAARPSMVLHRGELTVRGRREPTDAERASLAATAVVVDCQVRGADLLLALGQSAFTGFTSWLEASAPRT
jgi:hypothetical protein